MTTAADGIRSYVLGAVGPVGDMRSARFKVEPLGFGKWQPAENGSFAIASILDIEVDKWFSIFISYSGTENKYVSVKRARTLARRGGPVYIIPVNQEELHPHSYRHIIEWLSPEFRSAVARRRDEFMLSVERLNPGATCVVGEPTDDVDYY